ncbi:BatD family protein [Halioxenophilus aromaticivorans]|uniref:BatD family protein n=1 Tax=Halioxenophilus aromaticivorans TaxID=1306992 RepID=A0AAV3TXU1_9ALTE
MKQLMNINIDTFKFLTSAALCLLFCASSLAKAAEVTATVDRHDITIEETLNLKIRYQGKQQSNMPSLGDLEKNFDVLSQSRSNQFRSFNGQVESWVEWSLVIAPKRQGTLLIPSFKIDGDFTDAIEINVNEAKPLNLTDGEIKEIFLETELDQTDVYVQQQVLLTLRLNTALPVASINQRETLELPDAKVEEISEQRYNRTIDGRDYAVLELVFAIYPQESGDLEIPVMTWEANIGNRSSSLFDLYSRQNSLRRLRSEAQTITVKPKPASYTGVDWLPAKQLVISESWSDGFPNFVQGEPITRNITVMADGLTASQLPSLDIRYPQGINQYPESPKVDEQKSDKGILTNAVQTQALLVTKPGDYTLPEIKLTWWNTQKDKEETITLPERKITVTGSTALAPPPPVINTESPATDDEELAFSAPQASNSGGLSWAWLIASNLFTAIVVAGFLWFLLRSRILLARGPLTENSPGLLPGGKNPTKVLGALVKNLQQHCQAQDTKRVHATLLAISQCFSDDGKSSLAILEKYSNNSAFIAAVKAVDRSLYNDAHESTIDFDAIAQGAEDLALSANQQTPTALAPLNP